MAQARWPRLRLSQPVAGAADVTHVKHVITPMPGNDLLTLSPCFIGIASPGQRAILAAMARRTLIMLITLLALQFSWSAVSAYCMHETGIAAQHFGHHADSDAANNITAASDDKPADAKKTTAHAHCWSCAHGALSVNSLDGMPHPQVAEVAPVSTEVYLSSSYSAPPERPQWIAAA
ncbi:hypothetical protein [Janthinobacterium aquaticum]|uniref:hypothetical protein n=1 Tax=Janthinobacterium sp. FT58W TaxID=2654254 RepID=UPI0012657212|nr:hypothetical protein [Janthinobacterium sp. FT58W]KAB8044567.1 hypothetical protein GCM43_05040 [Janthinobacterium sp. FT58W]